MVRSTEGKEKGLSISLLRRLHTLYCQVEETIGVTDNPYIKRFTANLLSNYRCAPGNPIFGYRQQCVRTESIIYCAVNSC